MYIELEKIYLYICFFNKLFDYIMQVFVFIF
jgi:hypothetical protein